MNKVIGFIGAGNINSALIGGLMASGVGADSIIVSNPSADKLTQLSEQYGVKTTTNNTEVAAQSDVIILGVKPYNIASVCQEIAPVCQDTLVVSVAAGIPISDIAAHFPAQQAIVRVMPNTPSLVGKGASGICSNEYVSDEQANTVQAIFATTGTTELIAQESLMDLVTALSGSGPAYFFYIAEAMLKEATSQGMSEAQAQRLIYQTMAGAAELLQQSDLAPEALRNKVTSPGGTTAAALEVLQQEDVSTAMQLAVKAAVIRGQELAK
ncbi:MAG: pyrroline-5-carboxylate reductase [Gammaproteobacteria bacterium]